MNSLTWLLKSRSRESSLDRIGGDGQQDGDSRKSRLRTAWGGSRKDDKGKGKATPRDIAHGLRETESEAVDELLGAVERDQGVAAANQIERKASMGRDGLVRFGVPGVTERRRTRGLELVLDGGDVGSALESDSERDDDRVTLTDEERRRSRSQTPDDPSTSGLTSEHDGRGGKAPDSPPAPSMTPVDLPPLPPSPRMEDRAELASDESSAPPSSLPPAPPPPTPGPIRPTPRLPLLPPFGSRPSPDRKPSASAEKRSRIVARSAPVRWTVNLYLALRRLLSIIGVKLPRTEDPVMISAPDEKAPLLEKPAPEPKPRSYFPFFRRSAPPRPPSIFETTDEKADDRRRDRSASVASNASSDGGFESDGSLISNRLGRKASWFGRVRSTDRSGVSTPTEVGKVAPGASGKKLQALLRKPKTLVLDLDETLIHSTSRLGGMGGVSSGAGGWGGGAANGLKVRVVEVVLDGRIVVYHVYKRPWVDFFLKKVSSWYTVVIFTASLREYADPVIDWLDAGRGIINGRLFRESCTNIGGSYVKDLAIIDSDLSQVCLVDNSPVSYGLNQANGIPIEGWLNDPHDEGLLDLLPMLDSLRFTNDVRRILGLRGFSAGGGAHGGGRRR